MLALVRLPAATALVAAALLTGACGDDPAPPVEDPDVGQLDLSSTQLGEEVTVFGTVSDVLSINSFELVGALVDGEPLLVITPDAAPLDDGARVTVEGSVEVFEDENVSRFGLEEADLPPSVAGERFVLAERVETPVTGSDSD